MRHSSVEGSANDWGFDFLRSGQHFTIGQSPEILGNYQKFLFKIWTYIEKIPEEMTMLLRTLSCFAGYVEKIRIII